MIREDNIDFNWSYTKYKLFQDCERAYFLQYLSSKENNPNHQNIVLQRNLISKELWINKIIRTALIDTVKAMANLKNNLDILKLFKEKTNHTYNLDKFSLITKRWKNDPKAISIKEIYYEDIEISDLLAWAEDILSLNIMLFDSKLFEQIKSIPYQAFKDTSKPLSFNLSKYKIYCAPELLWEAEGNVNILNFVFNATNQDWPYLATINTLYINNVWHYSVKNIICETVFFDSDNKSYFKVYGKQSIPETKQLILDSIDTILSRLTYDGKIHIENFPETDIKEKCLTCKYKLTCQAK